MSETTISIAFFTGMVSFFAPCILPIIPAFLAYISGITIFDLRQTGKTNLVSSSNVILNSVFFVMGFGIVFSFIGVMINWIFSDYLFEIISGMNQIAGIIIIGFGVFLIASVKVKKLNFEKRYLPNRTKASYPLSFIFGICFAAGWTPCVGPILGTMLTLAATNPSEAFHLLLSYSAGLGIPFIIMAVFLSRATSLINKMSQNLKYYSLVLGVVIIILGCLVFLNKLTLIASFPLLEQILG